MPYARLMPSVEALQQAVREPLANAPRDHKGFAIYIFDRAREIDHQWALAKKLAEQKAISPTSSGKIGDLLDALRQTTSHSSQ